MKTPPCFPQLWFWGVNERCVFLSKGRKWNWRQNENIVFSNQTAAPQCWQTLSSKCSAAVYLSCCQARGNGAGDDMIKSSLLPGLTRLLWIDSQGHEWSFICLNDHISDCCCCNHICRQLCAWFQWGGGAETPRGRLVWRNVAFSLG